MDMKRFFLYAIVIAALALAGCGGNGGGGGGDMAGGGDPMPPAPAQCPEGQVGTPPNCAPPGPTPEEMALKDAQDAAMAAYMMAMGYVGGARDYVAMGNAQKYADMAKGASDMAAAATTSAMAEEYQMKAEMYRDQAMEAAMMRSLGITGLANKIINQSDIDNAMLEGKTGDDIPKPNSNLKARVGAALDSSAAAASTRIETPAIADADATTTFPAATAVANGSVSQGQTVADTPAALPTNARVAYTKEGLRYSVMRGTGSVLRGEDPTPLMTSGEKPSGGWPGAELVRTDRQTPGDATTAAVGKTYVNVYTDINAPTQLYTSSRTDPATANPLTLPASPAVSKLTADDGVPSDGSSFTGTYNANSLDNNPPVTGQFNCPSGVDCSISYDEDGTITAIQGYEFYPAAGVTKPDADYLAWGVWLTVPDARPTDADAQVASVGAFASGNQPFNVRAELKGTATYNGDATGLYAAGGYVDYFDADVTLNANFGGNVGADSGDATNDTEGDDLLGAVTGMVSNIRAGGMDIDGMLELKKANIIDHDAGGGTPDDGMSNAGFSATVSGTLAGRAMVGNWGGQFFGPNNAAAGEAGAKAAETEYPTTAAGTFGATAPGNVNDPVRILGSFGAWKAD